MVSLSKSDSYKVALRKSDIFFLAQWLRNCSLFIVQRAKDSHQKGVIGAKKLNATAKIVLEMRAKFIFFFLTL